MKLQTKHFGELEFAQDKIITFSQGLIAFEEKKRFIIINSEDENLPFAWMQSVDDPNLTFVIMNPFVFKKDYDFKLPKEVVEELDIKEEKDVAIFAIVVVPVDINKMTANLLAPLVINERNKTGKQVVLNDKRYTTKHLIKEELKKNNQGGCNHAGTDAKEK